MLNYIIQSVTTFFILTRYVDPITRHSREISQASRLVLKNVVIGEYRTELPIFIILAVITAIALWFFLNRTRMGFDLQAVGSNSRAARYIGISPERNILLAMAISGGLAGLAGVTHYLGFHGAITPRELSNTGFDAIAVALLGNANPIGAMFASVLITVISRGTTYMSSILNIQHEISQVITGLILLFSACGAFFKQFLNRGA
jgi:simple sugar transport system permease protein